MKKTEKSIEEEIEEFTRKNDWFENIEKASTRLRDYKIFILRAVREKPLNLRDASSRLKDDWDVVMEAVKNVNVDNHRSDGLSVLWFGSERIRNSKEFVLEALRARRKFYPDELLTKGIGRKLRNDREFLTEALGFISKSDGVKDFFKCWGREPRNNREFMMEILKIIVERFGKVISLIRSLFLAGSTEIRNDPEFAMEVIMEDVDLLTLGDSSACFRDPKFILEVIRRRGIAVLRYTRFVDPSILCNLDFILAAHEIDPESVKFSTVKDCHLLRLMKDNRGDVIRSLETYSKQDEIDENSEFVRRHFEEKLKKSNVQNIQTEFYHFERFEPVEGKKIQESRISLGEVHFNDLEIFRLLGRGAYGGTYLCRIKGKPEYYVSKIYNDQVTEDYRKRREVRSRDSLYIPYHKNIAPILSHQDEEKIDVKQLPDYASYWATRRREGSIRTSGMVLMKYHQMCLGNFEKIEFFVVPRMIRYLIEGLYHLHKHVIVHRDLHKENVFIDPVNGRLWIGDFGCALDLRKNPTKFKVKKTNDLLFSFVGTSDNYFNEGGYSSQIAPEIKNFDPKGDEEYVDYEKSDLYAAGLLAKWIYEEIEETIPVLEMFIVNLLKDDPEERIGFDEAYKESFRITEMSYSELEKKL